MTFEKRTLAKAEMGYAVSQLTLLGEKRPIVASEAHGPATVFLGEKLEPAVISAEPGGTMGFAAVPGRDDALFLITGFYPIFKAESAGIAFLEAKDGFREPWTGGRAIDLPFVHRIESVSTAAGNYLVAATVCGGKDFQDDWEKPGFVDAYPISSGGLTGDPPIRILRDIHKNHGLGTGTIDGLDVLLVSGTEGLFALTLPGQRDESGVQIDPWQVSTILEHEISEMGMADFDGDGELELAVIEPFHGDTFSVYKNQSGGWKRIYDSELAFGHGLTVGSINGEPVAVMGSRAGDKNLVCFTVSSREPFAMNRVVVDEGAATAGTTIVPTAIGDSIVASNPEFEEYALYTAKEAR